MERNKELILGFQGMRGFAILLIVISHCNWALNEHGNNIFTYAGAWGVSCFIMLSGFLAVNRFYETDFQLSEINQIIERKVRKCYPLHLLTFVVSLPLAVYMFRGNWGKLLWTAIFNLTLTQTMIPLSSVYFSFNAVSWYLSLDLILVLFLPFVLRILSKLSLRGVIYIIVGIFIIEILIALILRQTSVSHWISYICPMTRMLDYLVGGYFSAC